MFNYHFPHCCCRRVHLEKTWFYGFNLFYKLLMIKVGHIFSVYSHRDPHFLRTIDSCDLIKLSYWKNIFNYKPKIFFSIGVVFILTYVTHIIYQEKLVWIGWEFHSTKRTWINAKSSLRVELSQFRFSVFSFSIDHFLASNSKISNLLTQKGHCIAQSGKVIRTPLSTFRNRQIKICRTCLNASYQR